jgi:hypothetical protein
MVQGSDLNEIKTKWELKISATMVVVGNGRIICDGTLAYYALSGAWPLQKAF